MRAGLARGFSIPRVTLAGRDRTMEPFLAGGRGQSALRAVHAHARRASRPRSRARLRNDGLAAIREQQCRPIVGCTPCSSTNICRAPAPRSARSAICRTARPITGRCCANIRRSNSARARSTNSVCARSPASAPRWRRRCGRAEFQGDLPGLHPVPAHRSAILCANARARCSPAASYVVMKSQGRLNDTFGTLPRFRHGIIPVPDEIAQVYTSARGGLENCLFNTWNLPARPLYQLPALALHECTPGHSFQAALALEGPDRPEFRQADLFLRLWRGLGPLCRMAGDRDGHL